MRQTAPGLEGAAGSGRGCYGGTVRRLPSALLASHTVGQHMTTSEIVKCLSLLIQERRRHVDGSHLQVESGQAHTCSDNETELMDTLRGKYVSDFGLVKLGRKNTTRVISKELGRCLSAWALRCHCPIQGFVNENKRNGQFTDPVRRTLSPDEVIFIGRNNRHTTLATVNQRLLLGVLLPSQTEITPPPPPHPPHTQQKSREHEHERSTSV